MALNSQTRVHFHAGHGATVLALRRLPACEWSREECSPGSRREGEEWEEEEAPPLLQYLAPPIEGFTAQHVNTGGLPLY